MSENNTSDSYEVGYGKPPRNTQFRKGVSANPTGRPKKAPDFDHQLLGESKMFVTLNENGQRRRISKHAAVVKQLINQAMKGDRYATRTYLDCRQRASEKAALLKASQSSNTKKYDIKELAREELMRIAAGGLKSTEQETK